MQTPAEHVNPVQHPAPHATPAPLHVGGRVQTPPVQTAAPQHPALRATDGSHGPPALRQHALPPSPLSAQSRPPAQQAGAGLPGEHVAPSPTEQTARTTHDPPAHTPDGQTEPHRPQLEASDCESTQRSAQASRPDGQAQTPPLHACPTEHTRPHAPQFSASVIASMHEPPHTRRGAVHPRMHTPPVQLEPAAHDIPQFPQFAGSLCVLAQSPWQSVCDGGHDEPTS